MACRGQADGAPFLRAASGHDARAPTVPQPSLELHHSVFSKLLGMSWNTSLNGQHTFQQESRCNRGQT